MYLGWFDDDPKKTPEQKIREAVHVYEKRFDMRPNVVLVNKADWVVVEGITVRAEATVQRNKFWIGWE